MYYLFSLSLVLHLLSALRVHLSLFFCVIIPVFFFLFEIRRLIRVPLSQVRVKERETVNP